MRSGMIFFGLFIYSNASAQLDKNSVWLTIQMPVNVSEKWQWHNDAGYRSMGISGMPCQFYYRAGARLKINNQFDFAIGGAVFVNRSSVLKNVKGYGYENRLWQEANFTNKYSDKLSWAMRARVEQRWDVADKEAKVLFKWRHRFRGGIYYSFNPKYSIQVIEEWMHEGVNRVFKFNQNRIQINGLIHLNSSTTLLGGYMYLKKFDSYAHIAQFTFQKAIAANKKH